MVRNFINVFKNLIIEVGFLSVFLLLSVISYSQVLNSDYGNFPYEQSFHSTTQPGEISKPATAGSTTNVATFTADGVRLTQALSGQFGAIFVNDRRFSSASGINIEFEYMSYGGNGADGFTVFFFDESEQNPQIGSYGAAIGYSYNRSLFRHYPNDRRPGLTGAYLGIAFDSYGNFKTTRWLDEEIIGGIGIVAGERSHITLRGARGVAYPLPGMGTGYTGYPVLITQATKVVASDTVSYVLLKEDGNYDFNASSPYTGNFDIRSGAAFNDGEVTNPAYRKAIIDIYPIDDQAGGMYVTIKIQHGETVTTVIDKYPYKSVTKYRETGIVSTGLNDSIFGNITGSNDPLSSDVLDLPSAIPDFLRVGFAAATGQGTDIHMIKNLRITLPGAAEAYDDFDTTVTNTAVVISPLLNDVAYQGTISENQVGSNEYINTASFKFVLADGSAPDSDHSHQSAEGTWAYDPITGLVTFTPALDFEGNASIKYSIKGGLPGHTEPYADEAYRSLPATITVTVEPGCPFVNLTNGVLYIKDYGSSSGGTRDGSTWENAYDDLAEALQIAGEFPDCISEIWIATGTYYPKYDYSGNASPSDSRDITFYLPEGLALYGGFAGTETNKEQRNISSNPTILSGNNTGYHVILITNDNITLDGFVIQGGNANGTGSVLIDGNNISRRSGAGISIVGSTGVILNNLTITGNSCYLSGGGIYCENAGFSMANSTVYSNTTTNGAAGGITFSDAGNYFLKNTLIYGNTSSGTGRDLSFSGSDVNALLVVNFENVTVVSTSASHAAIFNNYTELTLRNSVITTNTSGRNSVWGNAGNYHRFDCYNSYVQGANGTGTGGNGITTTTYENSIPGNVNPSLFFVDITGNDFHLDDCSPLVNAGNNDYVVSGDKDLDGNDRINHDIVDLGVYEYQGILLPLHELSYNNPEDPDKDLLFQNVRDGAAIEDILFYYSGGATAIDTTGLPSGIRIEYDTPVDGRTPFKLTGSPNDDYGVYNYTITTIGLTNECTEAEAIEGTIIISPDATPGAGGILYVKKDAGGRGSSWEDALSELSTALLATEYDANIRQIWVGRGDDDLGAGQPSTFFPQYNIAESDEDGIPTTDFDKTFLLLNGIKLYGGFDPENGIRDITDQRDSSLTVLSGIIDDGVNAPYNVYHIMTAFNQSVNNDEGEVNHIVIDGFTFTGANANGTKSIVFGSSSLTNYKIPQNAGAGIYAEAGGAFITISRNNIYSNTASGSYSSGGGIYASGYVHIIENRIVDNEVSGYSSNGGGIATSYKSSGSSGGRAGVSSATDPEDASVLYIAYNQISNNLVSGEYASGGGIIIGNPKKIIESKIGFTSGNNVLVYYNTITDNKVIYTNNGAFGGGISVGHVRGGSNSQIRNMSTTIDGSIVIGYNWISNNEASAGINGRGGGLYIYNLAQTNIVNNVIAENTASGLGGGIYMNGSSYGTMLNNTVSANTASFGSGLHYGYGSYFYVYNSIIYGNITGEDVFLEENEYDYMDSTYISHNLIGTVDGDVSNLPANNDADGNIVGINPGFIGGTGNDRYNLQTIPLSPAVNAGENLYWSDLVLSGDLDFAGNARIREDIIDIGAYEAYICPFEDNENFTGIVYVKDYTQPEAGIQPADADGTSWEKAHPNLADVLKMARDYPGCIDEIWVAKGVYYPKYVFTGAPDDPVSFGNKYYSFQLVDNLKIYGGFSGSESSIDERTDIHGTNTSILSGDINQDDNYANIISNQYEGTQNNVLHVVVSHGNVSSNTILNGFTIQGGNAGDMEGDAGDIFGSFGGGIFISAPTTPTLSDLVVRYNRAYYYGGGIVNYSENTDNEPVTINNISIHNNIGEGGAGFGTFNRTLNINNFDIYGNMEAGTEATSIGGGGVCAGILYLRNGKITGNTSDSGAGLAVVDFSGNATTYYSLTNVTIAGNSANVGGGLLFIGAEGVINNSVIWGNSASTNPNISNDGPAATTINYSLIEGSIDSGTGWNADFGVDGGNNIDEDPQFVGSGSCPYQLNEQSPAVNTGSNNLYIAAGGNLTDDKDIAGKPRLIENIIDMGAYEAGEIIYTLQGTVFPFVYNNDLSFDTLFAITAALYPVPPRESSDPITEILDGTPLYINKAINYDGTIFVPGTPKNPGPIGSQNNPGLPIEWSFIGKEQGTIDTTTVSRGEVPSLPVGLFRFENVTPGDYILMVSRKGYLTRFAKITVIDSDQVLGHRELLPGDVNGDFLVNSHDISIVISKMSSYGSNRYGAMYDLNGDGTINQIDISLLIFYQSASMEMYRETLEWILEY